jgi:ABC-type transporter Mla MlaB component
MLRISHDSTSDATVLRLEGRLSGPWVAEARTGWTALAAAPDRRPLVVDLRDVLTVDAAGRALLAEMHRGGAAFRVCGCAMRELIDEMSRGVGL